MKSEGPCINQYWTSWRPLRRRSKSIMVSCQR